MMALVVHPLVAAGNVPAMTAKVHPARQSSRSCVAASMASA